jgi:hypothetical protein
VAGDLVILPMDADTLQASFPHWTIFEARNWWFALRSGECLEIYAGPRSLDGWVLCQRQVAFSRPRTSCRGPVWRSCGLWNRRLRQKGSRNAKSVA